MHFVATVVGGFKVDGVPIKQAVLLCMVLSFLRDVGIAVIQAKGNYSITLPMCLRRFIFGAGESHEYIDLLHTNYSLTA